jgi:hypothetical protein
MADEPCEFELTLLRSMAGQGEPLPWGAAVGAALEFLSGSGLVSCGADGVYRVTDHGHTELARREAKP